MQVGAQLFLQSKHWHTVTEPTRQLCALFIQTLKQAWQGKDGSSETFANIIQEEHQDSPMSSVRPLDKWKEFE